MNIFLICFAFILSSQNVFAGFLFTEKFTSQVGSLGSASFDYFYNPVNKFSGIGAGVYTSLGNEFLKPEWGIELVARSPFESISMLSSQTVVRLGRQVSQPGAQSGTQPGAQNDEKSFAKFELQHSLDRDFKIPESNLSLFVGLGVLLRGSIGLSELESRMYGASEVAPIIHCGAIF